MMQSTIDPTAGVEFFPTDQGTLIMKLRELEAKLFQAEQRCVNMETRLIEQVPKLAKLEAKLNVYRRIASAFVTGAPYQLNSQEVELLEHDGFRLPGRSEPVAVLPEKQLKNLGLAIPVNEALHRGVCSICGKTTSGQPVEMNFGQTYHHVNCP